MRSTFRTLLCLGLLGATPAPSAEVLDFDTRVMRSTLKVSSPESVGTGFIVSQDDPDDRSRTRRILVTAEHVLRGVRGDEATLVYQEPKGPGRYAKSPAKVPIRREGKALWTKHPDADVAVLEIRHPAGLVPPAIPVEHLATDEALERHEIHPADLIKCIGFPHPNQFQAVDNGFGVARLGCIASYPLAPTRVTKTFLCDLNGFEGDSGSAVYLADDRRVHQRDGEAGKVQLILGLVVGQHFIDEEYHVIYQHGKFRHRLGMMIVVHASAIKEAIDHLPRRP